MLQSPNGNASLSKLIKTILEFYGSVRFIDKNTFYIFTLTSCDSQSLIFSILSFSFLRRSEANTQRFFLNESEQEKKNIFTISRTLKVCQFLFYVQKYRNFWIVCVCAVLNGSRTPCVCVSVSGWNIRILYSDTVDWNWDGRTHYMAEWLNMILHS